MLGDASPECFTWCRHECYRSALPPLCMLSLAPSSCRGRTVLPADFTESRRWDLYRLHVAFVMACPPSLAAALEPARRSPALGSRELCRGLLAGVAAGSSTPHQMALLSLGHCHPEHYTALLEEVPLLLEECARSGSKKGRSRPEEVRAGRLLCERL